jgi:hypothetical protein
MVKRKPRVYEECHKIVNGVIYKLCSDFNEWFPMTEEYFYRNKSAPDGFYPYCKEATKKRSLQWEKDNPERYKVHYTKRNRKPDFKEKMKKAANKQRLEGKQKEWRQSNPDKLREYNQKHRDHDITDEEWFTCLDYFNNSCAYCGLSEDDQLKIYGHQLHREHVIHDGSNYIDNCIPACTKCNTSKHIKEFNEWYNQENEAYSKRRYNKIVNWMTKECFKVLNLD